MEDINKFIRDLVKKQDSMYIPIGKPTWRLPTGIVSLDKVLGGGIPGGTMVQIYGQEQTGKSSLALKIVSQSVKLGHETLYVPLENYSEQYAQACGVDVHSDKFHLFAGDFAEVVFNACIELIRNSDIRVLIIDSVSAASPRGALAKEQPINDLDKGPKIGAHASLVGDFAKKLQSPLRRKQCIAVLVNQVRPVIGGFSRRPIYNPTGGMALQYYTDVKLSLWPVKPDKEKEFKTHITVMKGKDFDCVQWGSTYLTFNHGKGADIVKDLVSYCEAAGLIQRTGAWYTYENIREHGLDNLLERVKADPALQLEMATRADSVNVAVTIDEEAKADAVADELGSDLEVEVVA